MDQRFNKLTEDLQATLNGVMEFLKLLNAEQEQLSKALTNGAAPLGDQAGPSLILLSHNSRSLKPEFPLYQVED
jgi:hypothetical protein